MSDCSGTGRRPERSKPTNGDSQRATAQHASSAAPLEIAPYLAHMGAARDADADRSQVCRLKAPQPTVATHLIAFPLHPRAYLTVIRDSMLSLSFNPEPQFEDFERLKVVVVLLCEWQTHTSPRG